jgi:plasmid stabilization system protein ParE
MAKGVRWSEEALSDIDGIAEFISRDSLQYAQQVVERLFELSDVIADQPLAGRIVPELEKENIRERFLYSYRLIYELKEDEVFVLAVIHGKRLLENELE